MLFFGVKNLWFKLIVAAIFSIWAALFVFWMYQSYFVRDPPNSSFTGTARYGRNSDGDFQTFALFLLVEYLILLGVLIPFAFSRLYWVRLLILQIVFGGWMMLLVLGMMHSGSVYMLHALAILSVNVIIFVLLAASIVAEIVNRRKNPASENV